MSDFQGAVAWAGSVHLVTSCPGPCQGADWLGGRAKGWQGADYWLECSGAGRSLLGGKDNMDEGRIGGRGRGRIRGNAGAGVEAEAREGAEAGKGSEAGAGAGNEAGE